MADELRLALAELLRKAGVEDADFLREGVRVLAQELMQLELAEPVVADCHERTPERSGYRNGCRERPWDTRVGTIELQLPRVRDGSSSRACWSPDGVLRRRWWPLSRRHTCRASPRGGSTTWCRRGACRASARARSVGCASSSIPWSSASTRANSRGRIRTLPGRDLRQSARAWPSGVAGDRDRDCSDGQW